MWAALVLGLRDYVRKNGAKSVVVGGVRRHRLARWSPPSPPTRSGGATSSASPCPAATRRSTPATTPPSWPRNLGFDYRVEPIQHMVDAFLANLNLSGLAVENLQARVRGGHPDGGVQSGGSSGADHRQQERAGRRLLDALRRLGRRLQPAQGRAQDAGVEAGPLAQHGRAGDPGELHHQTAQRRAAPGPAGHRLAARIRAARPDPRRTTSTATRAGTSWWPRATTPRWSTGCCAWSTGRSTSGASPRPGTKISFKSFGRDRRLPITNRFQGRFRAER